LTFHIVGLQPGWRKLIFEGASMAISTRDFVVQDLLIFFKSNCANPSLITGENSNAKHLCGYDADPAGWRLLDEAISELPHVQSYGYWLSATDMDQIATIGQIADALIKSGKAKQPSAALDVSLRRGSANFLPPRSVRVRAAAPAKGKKGKKRKKSK
jgi:hypothetical protein